MPMDRYYTQVMRVAVIDSMEGRIVAECVRESAAMTICTMLNDATNKQKAAEREQHRETVLMRKVDDLEVSVRINNALLNEGFTTVGEVIECSAQDLLRMPNFGKRSLHELQDVLLDMGLRLSTTGIKREATDGQD